MCIRDSSSPAYDSLKEKMPTMGFLEHLEELRKRIVYSIVAVLIGCLACWFSAARLVGVMQKPIIEVLHKNGQPEMLVYQHPVDPFNLYLKVAGVAGLFVASPFVLYQLWLFIAPGLYRNEKRYVMPSWLRAWASFWPADILATGSSFPKRWNFSSISASSSGR